jgi:hypothetical protein
MSVSGQLSLHPPGFSAIRTPGSKKVFPARHGGIVNKAPQAHFIDATEIIIGKAGYSKLKKDNQSNAGFITLATKGEVIARTSAP